MATFYDGDQTTEDLWYNVAYAGNEPAYNCSEYKLRIYIRGQWFTSMGQMEFSGQSGNTDLQNMWFHTPPEGMAHNSVDLTEHFVDWTQPTPDERDRWVAKMLIPFPTKESLDFYMDCVQNGHIKDHLENGEIIR